MTTKQAKTGDPRADRAQTENPPKRARRTRTAVATTRASRRPGATETAVQTKPEQQPGTELVPATTTAVTKRMPPKREGRPIADEKIRKSIAVRLMRAKEAGWTRPQIASLISIEGTSGEYAVWRFQESSRGGYAEHVDAIETALTNIETGLAKLPERTMRVAAGPSKAQLVVDMQTMQNTIESVRSLLDAVLGRPKVTAAEKKLAASVLDALGQE
ncbi:hypothetical protein [Amycolatopsis sp. lyj-23]|uniref:hypothetical protein n=1 Tax=Amycolatopsis sp. lyj-23 TaxID=2789283 RepID=UPI00397DC727